MTPEVLSMILKVLVSRSFSGVLYSSYLCGFVGITDVASSGGGFSNFFAMPSYQADAVTSFLTNHPPPFTAAQFNNSGTVRGFPDLSANGFVFVFEPGCITLILTFICTVQIMSLGTELVINAQ